jgi:hypothetical protein
MNSALPASKSLRHSINNKEKLSSIVRMTVTMIRRQHSCRYADVSSLWNNTSPSIQATSIAYSRHRLTLNVKRLDPQMNFLLLKTCICLSNSNITWVTKSSWVFCLRKCWESLEILSTTSIVLSRKMSRQNLLKRNRTC